MSEHLFAWRTTTTARLTDDAEAMGNDLDPVLCTVGPATAHRRPHAIQLLGRLFPTDLPSPAGPTFRLSATELLPFRERVQEGIGMPGAMAAVARPGILARIGHHRGPHRVGLDVPQNDEQVVAVLDDRRSEAALPDVAPGSLSPVVPPGVSDGQGLEDAADRLPGGRLEKQMKMVGHQAVAEERERVPCLGAGEIAKEHIPFAVGADDIGSAGLTHHFSLGFLGFSWKIQDIHMMLLEWQCTVLVTTLSAGESGTGPLLAIWASRKVA